MILYFINSSDQLMKILIHLFIIFTILSYNSFAQNSIKVLEDSLSQNYPENEKKVDLLNNLSKAYRRKDTQKALHYAEEAFKISQNISYKKGKAKSLNYLGIAYTNKGEYKVAETYLKQAQQLTLELKDKKMESGVLTSLGIIYNKLADFPSALQHYQKALNIEERFGNQINIAILSVNLGNIAYNQKMFSDAENYYEKAIPILETKNQKKALASIYNNLGSIYGDVGNVLFHSDKQKVDLLEKSIKYFERSLEMKEAIDDKLGIATSKSNLARLYNELDSLKQAKKLFEESIKLYDELENESEKTLALTGISKVQHKTQQNEESLENALKAYEEAKKSKILENLRESLKNLSDLYEGLGEQEKALLYYKKYINIKEKLFNRDNIQKITRLEEGFKFEKDKVKMNAKLDKERNLRTLYLLSFLALLIFTGIVVYFLNVKQKDNRKLEFQKNELVHKNEEILAQRNNLKQLNATKDKLFAIVAHDLKNPLSAFRAITQSLSENLSVISQEEIQYFLNKINNSSSQLYNLLQNLLQWAINQTGQLEYKPQGIDLQAVVKEVKEQLQSNADIKELQLDNQVNENMTALADPKMTTLVIRNLVSNAIKFTPQGGRVSMKVTNQDTQMRIEIKDTGIGISKADQNKLFKIEEDNSKIGTSAEKGTGLGLILCKELVEKQGGKIWVESEENKGSSFIFTLPKN